MNTLCRHIECLLVEHNCVIVPHLGGFIAQECPAQYIEEEQLFLPPYRSVSFNQLLQHNDGLLAEAYMRTTGTSYPEALHTIGKVVSALKSQIELERQVELPGLGSLQMSGKGCYEFTPLCGGLVAPDFYALDAVKMPPPISLRQQESQFYRPLQPRYKMARWGRTMIHHLAATFVLICSFIWSVPLNQSQSTPHLATTLSSSVLSSSAHSSAKPSPSHTMQQPHGENTSENIISFPKQEEKKPYSLVMASRVSRTGAVELIKILQREGFSLAHLQENTRIRRVLYGRYATEQEGNEALKKLRQQHELFQQAWLIQL